MKRTFLYPSQIQSISQIRSDLESLAQSWDIPPSELRQITMMVEELFSNIIRFAYEDNIGNPIDIMLSNNGTKIIILISDDGIPFNPLEYDPDQTADPVSMEDRGMGLSLIKAFADSIDYRREDGKNRLLIEKAIRSKPEKEQS
ncbi:MAG: ATP-binding protein [Bacteroidetes bacterium]|nr:ATP-binding protein [Bacteroidota bacterium]